jgi:predicted DNA-binding WGR domain protein
MEPITLTRIDEAANMHRFYRLSIQPGLFGDVALIREWGRIGSHGQSKTDWFDSEANAKDARFTLHMTKSKRGYE